MCRLILSNTYNNWYSACLWSPHYKKLKRKKRNLKETKNLKPLKWFSAVQPFVYCIATLRKKSLCH